MIQDNEIPYCGKHRGESHGESIQGYTAHTTFTGLSVTACGMSHWVWLPTQTAAQKQQCFLKLAQDNCPIISDTAPKWAPAAASGHAVHWCHLHQKQAMG